jgi:hypothetical protein
LPSPSKKKSRQSVHKERKSNCSDLSWEFRKYEEEGGTEEARRIAKWDDSTDNSSVKRQIWKEMSSLTSESEDDSYECEENDTFCGFFNIKYCDPISGKLGDWVQCQGKSKGMVPPELCWCKGQDNIYLRKMC